MPAGWLASKAAPDVLLPDRELARVVYVDHYGNAMTGLRPSGKTRRIKAGRRTLAYARTFEEARGPFWYENSMRLAEIAAPKASAARLLGLKIGSRVSWED